MSLGHEPPADVQGKHRRDGQSRADLEAHEGFSEKGEFVGVAAKARAINPSWEPADLILERENPAF